MNNDVCSLGVHAHVVVVVVVVVVCVLGRYWTGRDQWCKRRGRLRGTNGKLSSLIALGTRQLRF